MDQEILIAYCSSYHTALTGILSKTSGVPYRFVLIEEPKTWTEAQSFCRENHMDLATVQSDEDRAKLKEAANAVTFTSFAWIGFYNGVLTWRWSYKNTVISYTKWDSSQPDTFRTEEACAFIDGNQRWGDLNCLQEKYFVCQTGKNLYNTYKLMSWHFLSGFTLTEIFVLLMKFIFTHLPFFKSCFPVKTSLKRLF